MGLILAIYLSPLVKLSILLEIIVLTCHPIVTSKYVASSLLSKCNKVQLSLMFYMFIIYHL